MKKCLVYLYPIKEYYQMFELIDRDIFRELNDTIYKRYKSKGYDVLVTLFNDTSLYGIMPINVDGIIDVNMNFSDFTNIKGKVIEDEIEFPNPDLILDRIIDYSEVVITGFHYNSCVRKVLEHLLSKNINTLVDLDLTENFSYVHNSIFFNKEEYIPENFKNSMIEYYNGFDCLNSKEEFDITFNSPLFGFYSEYIPNDPKSIEIYLKHSEESVIKDFIVKRFRYLKIDDYNIDIYFKLLTLISKRLRFQGVDLLVLISGILRELDIADKPKIVDNIFKLLGYVSNFVLCEINGRSEIVNIYYPIYGANHPLVLYSVNRSILFIDYNGSVIKCPFFISLSEGNGLLFMLGKTINCNLDNSINMLKGSIGISDDYEADQHKLKLSCIGEINIEKDSSI